MTVTSRTIGSVVGVLVLLAVLFGLFGWVRDAIGAKARIALLEDQKIGLEVANEALREQAETARAATDSIGSSLDSLTAESEATVEEMGDTVEVVIESIREVAPPELLVLVEKADSIRVAQVEEVTRRAVRAEETVDSLRISFDRERLLWANTELNYQDQIANLEDQVETALAAMPGNFLQEVLDDPMVLAVGAVLGAAACYQWCPGGDDTVIVQTSAPLLSISTPF